MPKQTFQRPERSHLPPPIPILARALLAGRSRSLRLKSRITIGWRCFRSRPDSLSRSASVTHSCRVLLS